MKAVSKALGNRVDKLEAKLAGAITKPLSVCIIDTYTGRGQHVIPEHTHTILLPPGRVRIT